MFAGAPGVLNHSSFLSGKDVICAGSVRATNGRITRIDNLSGHYKPKRAQLWFAVCALKNCNVDLTQMEVVIAHEGDVLKKINNARSFWQNQLVAEDQTSADNGFHWV